MTESAICHLPPESVGAPRSFLFAIPPGDADTHTFGLLPHAVRESTLITLARLKQIHESGNVTRESDRIAAGLKTLLNGGRGTSAGTLRRQYYAYTRYGLRDAVGTLKYHPGDWRCVVDWAKAGPRARQATSETLPALFLEFWRTRCENHQRVTSEAYRELITIWQTGFDDQRNRLKEIPGYAEWPKPDPATSRPFGWTQRNLYRYAPDAFERTAARIGIQAASALGLKIRTTRVNLLPFEHVEFDDHEFNLKVNFPGQLRSLRPRCFGVADVLTSCCYSFVSKPTFWDEEEQAKKALTETDFMWFVVSVLTDKGFRTDTGSVLHVEHGTAAIRDDFAQRIHDVTGHKVTVARSGRFHKTAHGGQIAAPSGGNFRFKPIIESYWRMIDDRLDSLPGQVGKDRLHAPEEMERADAYTQKLLKAAVAMDPERAAELIIPRLTWEEFIQAAFEKVSAINSDFEHSLEGWTRAGFLLKEWRPSPNSLDWKPLPALAALPEPERNTLAVAISQNDLLYRVRKMARFEALQHSIRKTQSGITKLAPEMIPALVGPRHAVRKGEPLTVNCGVFEFEDWRISSDPLVFIAQDKDGHRFRQGDKFICYANPMAPHCLVACDKDHRVISLCPPMPVAAANDQHAVQASMGLQRSWFARALAAQRTRHAPDAAALEFMRRHNQAVLQGQPSAADKHRAREIRKAALSPETLLDGTPPSGGSDLPSDISAPAPEQQPAQFDPSSLL